MSGILRTATGKPGEVICRIAEEENAVMIVTGTRGMGKVCTNQSYIMLKFGIFKLVFVFFPSYLRNLHSCLVFKKLRREKQHGE